MIGLDRNLILIRAHSGLRWALSELTFGVLSQTTCGLPRHGGLAGAMIPMSLESFLTYPQPTREYSAIDPQGGMAEDTERPLGRPGLERSIEVARFPDRGVVRATNQSPRYRANGGGRSEVAYSCDILSDGLGLPPF